MQVVSYNSIYDVSVVLLTSITAHYLHALRTSFKFLLGGMSHRLTMLLKDKLKTIVDEYIGYLARS